MTEQLGPGEALTDDREVVAQTLDAVYPVEDGHANVLESVVNSELLSESCGELSTWTVVSNTGQGLSTALLHSMAATLHSAGVSFPTPPEPSPTATCRLAITGHLASLAEARSDSAPRHRRQQQHRATCIAKLRRRVLQVSRS